MATEARHDGYSDDDDDKPIAFRRSDHNGDSEDARSLSSIIFRNTPLNRRPSKIVEDESDDDEVPIASRLQKKNDKQDSTDEKNSSTLENEGAANKVSGKRLLEKGSSADQSSMKKLKVSSSSTSVSMKQDSLKTGKQGDKRKGKQLSVKEDETDDDDDVPIAKRIKSSNSSNSKKPPAKPKVGKQSSTSSATKSKATRVVSPPSKTRSKKSKKVIKDFNYAKSSKSLPSGDGKKKWTTLEHNGVTFPPPYEPHGVKILYKGKPVNLSPEQEEVATLFAVLRETNYYSKPQFRENFWNDWRKLLGQNHVIQKLDDCDFTPIYDWHLEQKKVNSKRIYFFNDMQVKKASRQKEEKYMWAVVDGVKEKVGNFNVEPPGLFRGRGDHPKMGKLKKRIHPCDVTLNLGKDAPIPECPIPGERWKGVMHYDTVTWLAYWTDPINQGFKYVSLSASSTQKGQSDKKKYEKARKLKDHVDHIRASYTTNFTAKDVSKRQIAVAIYLIDKLALRAGNEKGDDEADTVGCCTLKVGNVECVPPNKLKFDFIGKDSIQYVNTVEVKPAVYKTIRQFRAGKSNSDDVFDELDTHKLNAYLKELMPDLTAKVFRTYNASITLDTMLRQETRDGDVKQKAVVYQQANKEVAIICNHQRTVSKSHGAQVERLAGKIKDLKEGLKELTTNLERAKKGKAPLEGADGKKTRNITPEAWEKKIGQQMMKIEKVERDMQTKEDLKTVALGTSKINYMDPRITVAWCKRHEVPIEKIFNKSLLEKFAWAMDVEPDFTF
ncbi:PREDICTED: DNA topoisomerase 1 alpha-like [Camelina sativa]|uniref:DNA topoisomerase I n=1 Tax=Camelina sativa TaxID=90675 RepID=A0ABM1QHH9_CAMSA|nr:PREDICTED: DNA topoisomerase 1 alpha-like [Camelina sativa]